MCRVLREQENLKEGEVGRRGGERCESRKKRQGEGPGAVGGRRTPGAEDVPFKAVVFRWLGWCLWFVKSDPRKGS